MNSQQISHDAEHFGGDAWSFNPERKLEILISQYDPTVLTTSTGYLHDDSPLPHTAFGAGSRICPAVGISNRLTYAILMRLLLAFDLKEPGSGTGRKPSTHPIEFSDVHEQVVCFSSDRCDELNTDQSLR